MIFFCAMVSRIGGLAKLQAEYVGYLKFHVHGIAAYFMDVLNCPQLLWEGLYFHQIESAYPDEYRQWKTDKSGFKPEGGESIHDLSSRLQTELQNIINTHPGKTIAIVSHVGPIRAAVAHAMSMPTEMYRQLRIDYASLSRVDYGKSQNNLIYLNFSSQLVG